MHNAVPDRKCRLATPGKDQRARRASPRGATYNKKSPGNPF
jgi:hypothetical protein